MYHSFFGLREAPFSIAVNPRYLYMSPGHRDALAHLLYGLGAGGGFILLTGEVGTGKTTINRCLMAQLPDEADLAVVLNPALEARELLAAVCDELEVTPRGASPGLKDYSDALHAFLLANHARGRKTVLMIDEAQHLSFDALEQIRLLTNLETSEEKLLHIILIGQPELAARLARPELRQLNQRITARFELTPLSRAETAAYIRHRLDVAGLAPGRELFTPSLVARIHRRSGGIPRLINLLCDRMLLGAYGRDSTRLDAALLRRASREVLGGDEAAGPRRAVTALGLVAVVVVVALAGFLLFPAPPSPIGPASTPAGAVATDAPAPPAARTATPAPADVAAAPAGRSDGAPPRRGPGWFLSPDEGLAAYAALYGTDVVATTAPCAAVAGAATVACVAERAGDPGEALAPGRPLLLELRDARGFEGRAVLLGRDGDDVLLLSTGEIQRVSGKRLGDLWTGRIWSYWYRPEGIARTLALGDRGADVARAAGLFARLDGRDPPLADELFTPRLAERVRLFQSAEGLDADGVLGERTLRALVHAVGDDLTLEAARRRVVDGAALQAAR